MDRPSHEPRSVIPGSERAPLAGGVVREGLDRGATVDITIVVRARASTSTKTQTLAAQPAAERAYVDRATFAAQYGADEADIRAVERFVRDSGLHVTGSDAARRSVFARGTLADIEVAFGAHVSSVERLGATYRGRTGALTVPQALAGIVVGVFGIDDRPQARAQFRASKAAATATSYTPLQVAHAYDFPKGDGAGQTVALIELGGGYVQSDLDAYFGALGVASPKVTSVGLGGAKNAPTGNPNSADGEVMLDIEVVGAIAPAAPPLTSSSTSRPIRIRVSSTRSRPPFTIRRTRRASSRLAGAAPNPRGRSRP